MSTPAQVSAECFTANTKSRGNTHSVPTKTCPSETYNEQNFQSNADFPCRVLLYKDEKDGIRRACDHGSLLHNIVIEAVFFSQFDSGKSKSEVL